MLIGALHTFFIFLLFLYGVLFRRSRWDTLFLLITYTILLHWTFFNGECFISYLAKKKEDPNYIAGTDVFDLKDVSELGFDPDIFRMVLNIFLFVWIYSVFIVFKRNEYPNTFIVPFISIFIFYNFVLRWFYKDYENNLFQASQNISMFGLIVLGFYAIYLLYKKKINYI